MIGKSFFYENKNPQIILIIFTVKSKQQTVSWKIKKSTFEALPHISILSTPNHHNSYKKEKFTFLSLNHWVYIKKVFY